MFLQRADLFDGRDPTDGRRAALQPAFGLDPATTPPYLYALYSLMPGTNREIQYLLKSVVLEEMSHMALACNVLNAIGGSPQIGGPGFVPVFPGPLPGGVEDELTVSLERSSLQLVHDGFMAIEE